MLKGKVDHIKITKPPELNCNILPKRVLVFGLALLSNLQSPHVCHLGTRCFYEYVVDVNDVALRSLHPNLFNDLGEKPLSVVWNVCHK